MFALTIEGLTFQGGYSEFQNEDGLLIIDPQHFIFEKFYYS